MKTIEFLVKGVKSRKIIWVLNKQLGLLLIPLAQRLSRTNMTKCPLGTLKGSELKGN